MSQSAYYQEVLQPLSQLPIRCFTFVVKHGKINEWPMHWHRDIEILYCLEGTLEVQVKSQCYQLNQGDLLFINPEEIHCTKGILGSKILVLQMTHGFFSSLNDRFFFFVNRDLLLENSTNTPIANEIVEIYRLLEDKCEGYILKIYSLIYNICFELVCDYTLSTHDYKPLSKKNLDTMSEICDYIKDNLDQDLSLTKLGEIFSYTPQHLSSLFKKHLSISFLDYINGLRIDKAIPLLLHTEISLSDIAKDCGFASARAFNHSFIKHYGISPSSYRHQQKS